MKGLLKGLRYFTHMFESEKEPEMKIGLPTDVKHVAHIGMDGPSAVQSKPSWMNEFQTPPGGFQTPPASLGGEVSVEDPVKWGSQDNHSLSRKGSRDKSSAAKDMPQLPKSSKRTTSTNGSGESSTKEKTDKSKQSKKTKKPKDSNQATESTSKEPKKSKRKKVKELGGEGSSRRSRATDSDSVSETGSQFSCASEFIEGDNT